MQDDAIKAAVHAAMAKELLASIDTKSRDALLEKSMVNILKDWQCTSAITTELRESCVAATKALLLTEEWQKLVASTIESAMRDYLDKLKIAVANMITDQMHGVKSDSHYGTTYGTVLTYLKAQSKINEGQPNK